MGELHEVIAEKLIFMPLYMLFFGRMVKSLDMAIALRVTWIVVKVNDRAGPDIHAEVLFKLIVDRETKAVRGIITLHDLIRAQAAIQN